MRVMRIRSPLLFVLLAFGGTAALYLWLSAAPINSRRHADRIQRELKLGLTRSAVEKIMIVTPGSHNTKEYFWVESSTGYWRHDVWRFDGYEVRILIGDSDVVEHFEFHEVGHLGSLRPSFFERLFGR